MATMIPNSFTSYELTEEEVTEGSKLTTLQEQVLQNKLSQLATEKLSFTIEFNNLNLSLQREAELQGQLLLLQEILFNSLEAKSPSVPADVSEF